MTKKAQRSAARRRVRRSAVAMAPATAIGGLALVAGATTADAQPTLHASPGGGNASGCPSNNPCSLDNAIGQATLGSTIDLAQGTYAGPVTTLTESLNLVGAAEDTTIIKGGDPVIRVDSGAVVSISLSERAVSARMFLSAPLLEQGWAFWGLMNKMRETPSGN